MRGTMIMKKAIRSTEADYTWSLGSEQYGNDSIKDNTETYFAI